MTSLYLKMNENLRVDSDFRHSYNDYLSVIQTGELISSI